MRSNGTEYVCRSKDGTQRFDANILSCTYSSGRGDTVALTSDEGCALRPDLTTPFYKMRETANPNSELTLYAYFRVRRRKQLNQLTALGILTEKSIWAFLSNILA